MWSKPTGEGELSGCALHMRLRDRNPHALGVHGENGTQGPRVRTSRAILDRGGVVRDTKRGCIGDAIRYHDGGRRGRERGEDGVAFHL